MPKFDDKIKRPKGRWIPAVETDITVNWEKAKKEIEQERAKREELRKQIPTIGKRRS